MSTVMVRVGGAAAIVAGCLIVGQEAWELVTGPVGEGPGESAVHTTWVLAMVFGLIGMYLRQQHATGAFGQVATLVAILGTVTLFGTALLEVVVPADADVPEVRVGSVPVWMLVFVPGFALYLAGLVLFAAATWRAGVLPRGAAALLVLGVLAGLTLKGVLPGAMLVLAAAWIWLGAATLRGSGRAAAGEERVLAQARSAVRH